MHAGKQFCLQKTAFLYSDLSNLGLNQVRLADLGVGQTSNAVFFSSSSMSHLKDDIFIKGIYLKFNMAPEAERGEVKINPALFYKGSIYMAPKNLRSLWRKLSKNFRQIKDRRKFSLCN